MKNASIKSFIFSLSLSVTTVAWGNQQIETPKAASINNTSAPSTSSSTLPDLSKLWDKVSDLFISAKNSLSDIASYFGIDELMKLSDEIKKEKIAKESDDIKEPDVLAQELEEALRSRGYSDAQIKELSTQYLDVLSQYHDFKSNSTDRNVTFDQWASANYKDEIPNFNIGELKNLMQGQEQRWSNLMKKSLTESPRTEQLSKSKEIQDAENPSFEKIKSPKFIEEKSRLSLINDPTNKQFLLEGNSLKVLSNSKSPEQVASTTTRSPSSISTTKATSFAQPIRQNSNKTAPTLEADRSNVAAEIGPAHRGVTKSRVPEALAQSSTTNKIKEDSQSKTPTIAAKTEINNPLTNPKPITSAPIKAQETKPPHTGPSPKPQTTPPKPITSPEGGLLGNLFDSLDEGPESSPPPNSDSSRAPMLENFFQHSTPEQKMRLNSLYGQNLHTEDLSNLSHEEIKKIEDLIAREYNNFHVDQVTSPDPVTEAPENELQNGNLRKFSQKDSIPCGSDSDDSPQALAKNARCWTKDILSEFVKSTQKFLGEKNQNQCLEFWKTSTNSNSAFRKASEQYQQSINAINNSNRQTALEEMDSSCKEANQAWKSIFKNNEEQARDCYAILMIETEMMRSALSDPFNVVDRESFSLADEFKQASPERRRELLKQKISADIKSRLEAIAPEIVTSSIFRDQKEVNVCELIRGDLGKNLSGIQSCSNTINTRNAASFVSDDTQSSAHHIERLVRMQQSLSNVVQFTKEQYKIGTNLEEIFKHSFSSDNGSTAPTSKKLAYEILYGECSPLRNSEVCETISNLVDSNNIQTCDLDLAASPKTADFACSAMSTVFVKSLMNQSHDAPFALKDGQIQILNHLTHDQSFNNFIETLMASRPKALCDGFNFNRIKPTSPVDSSGSHAAIESTIHIKGD